MKTFLLLLVGGGLLVTGCVTGKHQNGNLARVIAQQLTEYGAEFPHINLQQPGIGIDQMYTSWRWEADPGGFSLTFRDGAFEGVLHQMKQIAGEPEATSDGRMHVWRVGEAAHVDLVRLPSGEALLTCRRLAGPARATMATEVAR